MSIIKNQKLKNWIDEKKTQVADFYSRNKEWLIPLGISVVGVAVKQGSKMIAAKKQTNAKELYWYDPSAGHYWRLRRSLDRDEALEVDRRHQKGERYGDIFESMKILK